MPSKTTYVHGYGAREQVRLQDQAATLVDLLHHDTFYPPGSRVLEAGCGNGAQTVTLAPRSPGAHIVSVDISGESVAAPEAVTQAAGLSNVQFGQGDIFSLPFAPASFDHVFVCFVLEHLARPVEALVALRTLLQTRRDDHGDRRRPRLDVLPPRERGRPRRHPLPDRAAAGGGRQRADRPRTVPAAPGRRVSRTSRCRRAWSTSTPAGPGLVDGFTRKTFTAMIEGVRDTADRGRPHRRRDLRRGHPGSAPDGGGRRRLLLHLLQGRRHQAGRRSRPRRGMTRGMKKIDVATWDRGSTSPSTRLWTSPTSTSEPRRRHQPARLRARSRSFLLPDAHTHGPQTAHQIVNFRYRIVDGDPVLLDRMGLTYTYMPADSELFINVCGEYVRIFEFHATAQARARAQGSDLGLGAISGRRDLIGYSAVPWVQYTHFVRTIAKSGVDSNPKMSWGKYFQQADGCSCPSRCRCITV